jgi:hypothetical protein
MSTTGTWDGSTAIGTAISSGIATCPAGKRVTGGGATIVQGNKEFAELVSSAPTGPSSQPTGWQASALISLDTGSGNGTSGTITAYVICTQ